MAKKIVSPAQERLFGDKPTDEELQSAVVLYEPDAQRLKSFTDELLFHYNKDNIYHMAQVFHPMLKNKLLMLQKADGQQVAANDLLPLFSMAGPKDSLAWALAYILADQRNLQSYVDSLDDDMRNLWRHLLLNFWCSEETAQQLLHTTDTLYAQQRYYYAARSFNKRGFDFFNLNHSLAASHEDYDYRHNKFFITIGKWVHGIFFPLFFPEAYGDPTMSELADDSLRVCNCEEESLMKFNLLSSLLKTGKLGMTARGVSQADMKRVAKQLGMNEFFSGQDALFDNLRARFYIEMLTFTQHLASDRELKRAMTYPDYLRLLLKHKEEMKPYLPSIVLPHIKGLNKAMKDGNRLVSLFQFLLSWLQEEPERWTSLKDIVLKLHSSQAGTDSLINKMMVFPESEQKYSAVITNECTGQPIAADSFAMQFGMTAFQSFALMLCSLGIAEVALSPRQWHSSPFMSADSIRLTPLGRYVLGVSDEYEQPQIEQQAYFELDPDRLIIRSLVEPNPYAQLLLDTSVVISRNRFVTSAQSFLAHCTCRSDVEEKIGIFRQFVSSELPPLWKQFFDSLLQHCNPLEKEVNNYYLFRLSPDNTDLIRLLTTDSELRQLFIRAEGYLILVKQEHRKRFVEELKKHGYLL